jgi:hypothetical protein
MELWKSLGRALVLIALWTSANADQLWNNGNHEQFQLFGTYDRIMDDFYVPSGGWWIDKAEVYGLFLGYGSNTVQSVNIRIIEADPLTGEPDPSQAEWLPVTSFDKQNLDPWGFKLEANFHKTYLKGQRVYWIEFDVIAEDNDPMRGLESDGGFFQPAYGNYATGNEYDLHAINGDLAFNLFGQEVKTIDVSAADDFKVKTLDDRWHALTFNLTGMHDWFEPGLYQIQLNRKRPTLYRFDEDGKHIVDFKVEDRGETRFTTPLGDDMCEKAPDILQSYCQSFVACAAYTFCGAIPIP